MYSLLISPQSQIAKCKFIAESLITEGMLFFAIG